jgi:hypothetical protein
MSLGRPRARGESPEGRQALERGGESPEGASGPRARRSLHDVASGPRARRRITRGVLRPIGWWAVVASSGHGPFHFGLRPHGACFWGSRCVCLCFIIFSKRGFSLVVRGPLWLFPTLPPHGGSLFKTKWIHKVLMDGGSSINVLYASTLSDMGIPLSQLCPSPTSFHGVVLGLEALPIGHIDPPVTFGTPRNFRTETLTFEVVGFLGRTTPSSEGWPTRSLWSYQTIHTSN